MREGLRIAVVWNHASRLRHCSFRFEQYLRGFEELGHEALIVCSEASGRGYPETVTTVEGPETLEEDSFWRSIGADVVAAVTWHRMSPMLAAARRAGARVLSIADSDGRIGLRSHPGATLQRSFAYARTPAEKARCLYAWLKRAAVEGRRGSVEDREYLASTLQADAVILGNSRAKAEFARFLRSVRRPDLDERVHVVPFAIAGLYLSTPLPGSKRDRVVAIGRWRDPQKDAPLLARSLALYLTRRPDTEVLLVGEDSGVLRDLEARFASVRCLGLTDADELAGLLGESRVVLFSSRWEGSPHAAFEAMAMGSTLVGTPIPCFLSWSAEEGFGSVATDRRPASLARALEEEMLAWRSGRRDAASIAGHWRARLEPASLCRQMLETLSGAPS